VGTHRGLVNPVGAATRLSRAAGAVTFVDACQSVGQLPVDVRDIPCDVLTATGRKWLRGPRGTGLVYVRSDIADRVRPIGLDGRSAVWDADDHYRLEAGSQRFVVFETPVAVRLGLGTAIDHVLSLGIDSIATRIDTLAEDLRRQLTSIDGVTVHDGGRQRCGIVTFTVARRTTLEVADAARAVGVNVNVSGRPSARLDFGGDRPEGVVRASPHYYNNEDDLGRLIDVVARQAPR